MGKKISEIKAAPQGGHTAWGIKTAVWFSKNGRRYYAGPFWSGRDALRFCRFLRKRDRLPTADDFSGVVSAFVIQEI